MSRMSLGRAIAERVLGIDRRRSLPPFARSLNNRWKEGDSPSGSSAEAPVVALFGDCFTMFNEPGIGLAARRVFEAFGYRVVLADAGCCGRAKISTGLLGEAIDEVDATVARLLELIADTRLKAIIVAEPSCLSAIKDDWLALKVRAPLEARRRLAAMSFLPEQFLELRWGAHPQRPRFRSAPREVVLHGHCHQKALWGVESSAAFLRRVCGPSLLVLDSGCCGMAGSFGYLKRRFDLSQKIGELVLLPAARKAEADATIVAPGTSCRHQVHDGAGRHAQHPIEFIDRMLAR